MKSVLRFVVAGIAFGAAVLSAETASAAYACDVRHMPITTSGYGSGGYVVVNVYTGADCNGTYVSTYFLCTTGATVSNCTSTAGYRFTEASLLTQLSNLRATLVDEQPISVASGACNGGGTGCLAFLYYQQ